MNQTRGKFCTYSCDVCFVAFIDVLGFRNDLKKDDSSRVSAYFRAVQAARKSSPSEVEYKVLGDAIVLSILVGDTEMVLKWLRILLSAVAEIQLQLALSDFWTRGAISSGTMYFYVDEEEKEDRYYTGYALARAYELELGDFIEVHRVISPECTSGASAT